MLLISLLDWTIINAPTMDSAHLAKIYDEICATLGPLGEHQLLVEVRHLCLLN